MNSALPIGTKGLGLKLTGDLLSAASSRTGTRKGKLAGAEKVAKDAEQNDDKQQSGDAVFSNVMAGLLEPAKAEAPQAKAPFRLNLWGSSSAAESSSNESAPASSLAEGAVQVDDVSLVQHSAQSGVSPRVQGLSRPKPFAAVAGFVPDKAPSKADSSSDSALEAVPQETVHADASIGSRLTIGKPDPKLGEQPLARPGVKPSPARSQPELPPTSDPEAIEAPPVESAVDLPTPQLLPKSKEASVEVGSPKPSRKAAAPVAAVPQALEKAKPVSLLGLTPVTPEPISIQLADTQGQAVQTPSSTDTDESGTKPLLASIALSGVPQRTEAALDLRIREKESEQSTNTVAQEYASLPAARFASAPAVTPAAPAAPAVTLAVNPPERHVTNVETSSVEPVTSAPLTGQTPVTPIPVEAPVQQQSHSVPAHADAAPTPTTPVTVPEPLEQPKQPLRNFSLEFTPDGAKDVRLHLSQHSGDVRVSLHSTDTGLSSKLRDGVQDLFGNLDSAGYEASSWNPQDGGRRRQQQEQEPAQPARKPSESSEGFDNIMQNPVQTQEIQ